MLTAESLEETERGWIYATLLAPHLGVTNDAIRESLVAAGDMFSATRGKVADAVRHALDEGLAPDFATLAGILDELGHSSAQEELLECATTTRFASMRPSSELIRKEANNRRRKAIFDEMRIRADRGENVDPFEWQAKLLEVSRSRTVEAITTKNMCEITFARLLAFTDGGGARINLGIGAIDHVLGGLDPGGMTVVGARPSVGKSTLALMVARRSSVAGISTSIISCEDPPETWATRYVASAGNVSATDIRTGAASNTNVYNALTRVSLTDEDFLLLDCRDRRLEEIVHIITVQCRQARTQLVLVDYAQSITTIKNHRDARSRIDDVINSLKKACATAGAHLVLFSQLRRGDGSEPTREELKESGRFEEAAENILLMWRDGTKVHGRLAKNKNGVSGTLFAIRQNQTTAAFDDVTEVFDEPVQQVKQKGRW